MWPLESSPLSLRDTHQHDARRPGTKIVITKIAETRPTLWRRLWQPTMYQVDTKTMLRDRGFSELTTEIRGRRPFLKNLYIAAKMGWRAFKKESQPYRRDLRWHGLTRQR